MGYACPVCGDPQADAEHLANHLAFTALLGDAAHEDWLAEHAPNWDEADADTLASTVVDHAEEVEFPQVFEDTTGGHDHGHDHAEFDDTDVAGPEAARERARRDRELDAQSRQVLEDAREMTRQMLDAQDESDADDDSETE
jgi:hypothetical protein